MEVHVLLPPGIDDPARPSGGNVYDRRVCGALVAAGWQVHEHTAAGDLGGLPDGSVVLVDGLVASARDLLPQARRLRLVVLVHMPLGPADPDEREVLGAAAGIVVTSRWSRRRLLEWYPLAPDQVRVAEPGTDAAEPAPGAPAGSALLCVGAVTPTKGHDLLVEALALLDDLDWDCRCVGSLEVEPAFAARVRDRAARARFTGPETPTELDATYAEADLLVLTSRAEAYGMVVTEALARGLPVVATDVGGVREALGRGPGVVVPPEDPVALAAALRRWLTDGEHRRALRAAASARRASLGSWTRTAALVAGALTEVTT